VSTFAKRSKQTMIFHIPLQQELVNIVIDNVI
jgi:hypothetical protein